MSRTKKFHSCKLRSSKNNFEEMEQRKHNNAVDKPYNCSHCSEKFTRLGHLAVHVQSKHRQSTKMCHQCPQCRKRFSAKRNLASHMRIHTSGPFKCLICSNSAFKSFAKFKNHMQVLHQTNKPYLCIHCQEYFSTKRELNNHQKRCVNAPRPNSIKPWKCTLCTKTYAYRNSLKSHMRSHTGEYGYYCLICTNVAYQTYTSFKTHMLRVHQTDKPYYCITCKEFFKPKRALKIHQTTCGQMNLSEVIPLHKETQTEKSDSESLNLHLDETTRSWSNVPSPGIEAFGLELVSENNDDPTIEPTQGIIGIAGTSQQMNYPCLDEVNENANRKMTTEELRLKVASLLKKVSTKEELKLLDFHSRHFDDVLNDFLVLKDCKPYTNLTSSAEDQFRKNTELFLEWAMIEEEMAKYLAEGKTIEDIISCISDYEYQNISRA